MSAAALAWNVAVPPDEAMVIACGELVRVKSGAPGGRGVLPPVPPTPVNVTDCGEFCACPEIVSRPFALALLVGAKVTWMVQLAPPARVAGLTGQLFVCLKGIGAVILEIVIARDGEMLVSVTVFAALVVPTAWFPKSKVDTESCIEPCTLAPVPATAMV